MKIGIAAPLNIQSLSHYLDIYNEPEIKGLGGTAIDNLVNGLLEHGMKVSVFTLDKKTRRKVVLKGSNLTIYVGYFRNKARYTMLDFFYQESKQIKEFILLDQPDVVHANWSYEFAIGTILSRKKHLITFHDNSWKVLLLHKDLYRGVRYLMDRWVKLFGQNFNVISPYLQTNIGVKEHALPIVPVCFPDKQLTKSFKEFPKDRVVKFIVINNGWDNLKNTSSAVLAFQKLKSEKWVKIELHIFGKGCSYADPGYAWMMENNLTENVVLYGETPHEELMRRLPEYDILVHPSKEESFGIILLEAMALGIPIVAGERSGAVPWVLNYGKNGILVDVESPEQIAKGVKNLLENKDLYETLSKSGLDRVKNTFSTAAVVAKYLNLYSRILNYGAL